MVNIPIVRPISKRYVSFWVLCGLPGTGKTTTCGRISKNFEEGEVKVITRDVVRNNLLWDIRKQPELENKIKNLDIMVTEKVLQEIENTYLESENPPKAVIIDGCHTDLATLNTVLYFINTLPKQNKFDVLIHLVVVGSPDSLCNHALTDKQEGDYSDYKGFFHCALPKLVYERKKKEFEETYDRIIKGNVDCDFLWQIDAYTGVKNK